MLHRSANCLIAACLSVALGTAAPGSARAVEPMAVIASIPEQPLAEALAVFARQTGLHIVYVSRIVRGHNSRPVKAGLGATEALASMLRGTGLKFEYLTPHSVRILATSASDPLTPSMPMNPPPYLPEVMVTGSRIALPPNMTAASPMQVVTVQEIQLAGHTDAVDVISSLPQMISTSGADFGNHSNPTLAAGGFATADLRGLGPQRTVVLINGRRLGLGDPNTANPTPAPDLDQIPLAMVERVEVLTGGASATYGTDAVAGVINFILKNDLQGIQVEGQYGFANHTQHNTYLQQRETDIGTQAPQGSGIDGFRRGASVLAGTDFGAGAGHVTGYFTYQSQNPLYGSERDFSDCSAHSTNSATGVPESAGITCLVSSQSNFFNPDAGAGNAYSVVGNRFVPWPAEGAVPPARFNSAPYFTSQRRDKRYQAGLQAHLDINASVKPYFELSYMSDDTQTQFAPSGLFAGANPLTEDGGYAVNCSNPLLSAQQAAILCTPAQIAADKADPGSANADVLIARRNIEGGGRRLSFKHRNYRVVAGSQGSLGDDWSYNAYALYYYTSLSQRNLGFLSNAAITNALQVRLDRSGRPVCISGASCVPYDIFTAGAVTAEQLRYLEPAATDGGSNSERIAEADVTGQLGRYGLVTPWSHEGVSINFGAERRTETLRFSPDAIEQSGDLSGYGTAPVAIDQRVSVSEGFGELRIPVLQDQRLAKDLTVSAGYRYSVYSTAGVTNTYRFDLQFAPVADARLRASYDRVVRAPNLIELYTPLSYGLSQTIETDPCAPTDGGLTHAAASLAACMRTGVTAAQYGNGLGPASGGTSTIAQCPAGCGVVSGGNQSLAPETADTWSFGVTLTPTSLPAFTGSVDYYHIHLKGEIGTVPESVTLSQCLNTGDPILCSQIVRTPSGALIAPTLARGGYVLSTAVNTGAALVSGMDVQANYRQGLPGGWGSLGVALNGSWLLHNASTRYRSAPGYDCAGLFGDTCLNGSVNPTWRHNLRLTWESPWDAQISLQWRFIGGTAFDNNSSQPLLQGQEEGFSDPLLTHIPGYSYLDLSALWNVTPHIQLRAGVNNVTDRDPPFVPLEISGRGGDLNTFQTYDIRGRDVFLAVRARL